MIANAAARPIKVISGLLIYGIWIVVVAGLAGVLWGPAPGLAVLAGMPMLALTGLFAIERETAACRTARAWISLRGARPVTRAALKRRRAELAAVLDDINEWLER